MTNLLTQLVLHRSDRYLGCLIYHTKYGYVWNRKAYPTLLEARQGVRDAIGALQMSIKR